MYKRQVLGLRVNALHAMGSHVFGASMVVPLFAMRLAPGVYQIPAVHCVGRAVFTNTIPLAPYRGAGRPEANYALERAVEEAARVVGMDPVRLRKKNLIPASAMPFKTPINTYDSGDFPGIVDKALKLAEFDNFNKRKRESAKRKKLRGIGISCMLSLIHI